jgi:hypothetical protein
MADSSKLTDPAAHARFWNFSRRSSKLLTDEESWETCGLPYVDSLLPMKIWESGVRGGRREATDALLWSIPVADEMMVVQYVVCCGLFYLWIFFSLFGAIVTPRYLLLI